MRIRLLDLLSFTPLAKATLLRYSAAYNIIEVDSSGVIVTARRVDMLSRVATGMRVPNAKHEVRSKCMTWLDVHRQRRGYSVGRNTGRLAVSFAISFAGHNRLNARQ